MVQATLVPSLFLQDFVLTVKLPSLISCPPPPVILAAAVPDASHVLVVLSHRLNVLVCSFGKTKALPLGKADIPRIINLVTMKACNAGSLLKSLCWLITAICLAATSSVG